MVIDQDVLYRMVEYAELNKRDTVLEIGTGIGNLTEALAVRAGRVITVEKDERMIKLAMERVRAPNVEFIHGDIFKVRLPEFNKIVSNLPYGISSRITFWLLERNFELAVLMYQKEFAERLVAVPGTPRYGRITVNFWLCASAEILEVVPPEAFYPRPKVFSAIVRVKRRAPPTKPKDPEMFRRVVRALFQHRQQKVRNALEHSFGELFPEIRLSKSARKGFLDAALPPRIAGQRVMRLTPEEIIELSDILLEKGQNLTSP